VRSVVACLPSRPAVFPFAADSSEPDRPQAVKASAVEPPLRGFGLDGLTPPRFGLSKQTKADWGRTALPTPDRYACTNHVLGNGCDNARRGPQGSGKPRADRIDRAHDDAGHRRQGHAPIRRKPTGSTASRRSSSESTRPELAEAAKSIAKIVPECRTRPVIRCSLAVVPARRETD
jgi:hypothetical protein